MTAIAATTVAEVLVDPLPGMALPPEEVRRTLLYLAHKLRRPVHLRALVTPMPYSAQTVQILVQLYESTRQPSRELPQVTLQGRVHSLDPSQRTTLAPAEGQAFIADDTGQVLAMVDCNCVVIFTEITAVDNEAAWAILAHVAEQAVPLLRFEVTGHIERRRQFLAEELGRTFRQAVTDRLHERRRDLENLEREAETAYYTLVNAERRRGVLENEVEDLEGRQGEPKDFADQAAALVELESSGQYQSITCLAGGVVQAVSGPITIHYDDYEFDVGRYHLTIDRDGRITIKGLDNHPRADHCHPHVGTDGRPCLGNIAGDLGRLIGRLRLAEALQLLHAFLCSYNPENPYEKIARFDPDGDYSDPDDDPCDNCDENCTSYCITGCEHNDSRFGCSDCSDCRSDCCYDECSFNSGFESFHPCDDCTNKGESHCYLECARNRQWQLQDPCEDCSDEACGQCDYHERKESLAHEKAS